MNLPKVASGILAIGGIVLIGMGVYFGFLRPPLLPEDLRYIGASQDEIQSALPGLQNWLSRVFGVLGGYMGATGLLTLYLGATGALAQRSAGLLAVVAAAGFVSIGWMAIINFLLDSDFKWLLLSFTSPWILTLALILTDRRR